MLGGELAQSREHEDVGAIRCERAQLPEIRGRLTQRRGCRRTCGFCGRRVRGRRGRQRVMRQLESLIARQASTLIEEIEELVFPSQVAAGLQVEDFNGGAAIFREHLQQHGGDGWCDHAIGERSVEQMRIEVLPHAKARSRKEKLKQSVDTFGRSLRLIRCEGLVLPLEELQALEKFILGGSKGVVAATQIEASLQARAKLEGEAGQLLDRRPKAAARAPSQGSRRVLSDLQFAGVAAGGGLVNFVHHD